MALEQQRRDVREGLGHVQTAVSFAYLKGIQTVKFDMNASSISESSSADLSMDAQFRMTQIRGHDHGMGL